MVNKTTAGKGREKIARHELAGLFFEYLEKEHDLKEYDLLEILGSKTEEMLIPASIFSNRNLGGFEAARFEYEIRNPDSKWNKSLLKTRRVVICAPERSYTISGSAQLDKFDEYSKDLDKMIQSMKIITD